MNYTLALLFTPIASAVLLIRKRNKPVQHIGLYNGIGGKIEPGESSMEGMVREIDEESGVKVAPCQLEKFAVMRGSKFQVHCYRGFIQEVTTFKSIFTEEGLVEAVALSELDEIPTITNLKWVIEMALDRDPEKEVAVINYK